MPSTAEPGPASTASPASLPGGKARRRRWAAYAFAFGLVLGAIAGVAAAVAVLDDGLPGSDAAPATPGATPTPQESAEVPPSCVRTAELSEEVVALAREATDAVAQLDARTLRVIVDQMQQLDVEIRAAAQACQEAAESATPGTAPPTGQGTGETGATGGTGETDRTEDTAGGDGTEPALLP
jgi:hypothetical protein